MDWIRKVRIRKKPEDNEPSHQMTEVQLTSPEKSNAVMKEQQEKNIVELTASRLQPEVIIDPSEYDASDLISTFKYAISKYGETVCKEPDRLKNILMDMAPTLGRELKLFHMLCKKGNLYKAIGADKWADADLYLWTETAADYLIREELIDRKVAYDFSRRVIIGISGKEIRDIYTETLLEKDKAEAEELKRKTAAKERAAKAAETRRKNADAAKAKELEEIKRKLEEEKRARLFAEAKVAAEQAARKKEKQEAERRLEEEKRRQTSHSNVLIDYSEHATAQRLFDKYSGKIQGNIVVTSDDWIGDFCFVIDEIVRKNGLKARGTLYKDGEFHRNYSYPADEYLFRMYNGPSLYKINQNHVKRSADPVATTVVRSKSTRSSKTKEKPYRAESRFSEGRTLKEFFENNGFEVIDKRYNNGCLWVVGDRKTLDPYIEMARMKFGSSCTGDFASGRATNYRPAWWTKCSK